MSLCGTKGCPDSCAEGWHVCVECLDELGREDRGLPPLPCLHLQFAAAPASFRRMPSGFHSCAIQCQNCPAFGRAWVVETPVSPISEFGSFSQNGGKCWVWPQWLPSGSRNQPNGELT